MLTKIIKSLKSVFQWAYKQMKHKLHHLELEHLKKDLKEGGIALIVIIITWEIIEDILLPVLFGAMGHYIHPVFYVGIPVAWLMCFHWLVVPILWGLWMKYRKQSKRME